jgi:signal transduction histidine kinase
VSNLDASKPFRSLTPAEQDALRQIAQERSFSAGQQIFKEGDSGDGIYVVKEGLVEISVNIGQSGRHVFAKIGPGELFGEMAVVELKPRSATALASVDTQVYFIPRNDLLHMLEKSPTLSLDLLREISQRLREFNLRYIAETIQAERLAVVGRFARSIIHDLKNPLSIISMSAELMAMQPTKVEMRETAQARIRKQVERIGDLIGDILDFTNNSQARSFVGNTNYAAFVQAVLDEIRPDVELRRITLEAQPAPAIALPIDPKRLRRVFHNLIQNAADAMAAKGGNIFVRHRVEKNEVITEIEDTGPGIAPQIANSLFEAFATFGKEHGTGLGLSICKKIVEDHHGRIWARNEPGKGAVFAFALPLPEEKVK